MARTSERSTTLHVSAMLLFFVATSIMSSFYISGFLYSNDLEIGIENVKAQLICDHEDCDREKKQGSRSQSRPRRRRQNDGISAECSRDPRVLQEMRQIINSAIESGHGILEKDTSTSSLLESARKSFSNPNRFIVQWILKSGTSVEEGNWTTISNYHSADSVYTVSSGPEGIKDSGTVVIPEVGLYNIYGRVTFACKEADGKPRRLQMRMTVEEDPKHPPIALLEEVEEARCRLKGDVGTLNVNGLFRLSRGNKIALQYRLPKNIGISNSNAPFKTLIGVYKVGMG